VHAGETGVSAELKELRSRRVIEPKHYHELTFEEQVDAQRYLMFLKEKHIGQIIGRGCLDGRKQRLYMQKEDTTLSFESLLISATIDAHEQRDVATTDIPGAFLQAEIVWEVHVKLEGRLTYTRKTEKLQGMLIKKAWYETLQAAMLFGRI